LIHLPDAHARLQVLDGAAPHDAYVAERHGQLGSNLLASSIGIKGEEDDRSLPGGELLDAGAKPLKIELGWTLRINIDRNAKSLEKALAAYAGSARIARDHPAGSEDERGEPLWLADTAVPKALDGEHEYLLNQIVCHRVAPQVTQPVEANPRSEAPT
jgi:hypothetical protein